MSGVGRREQRDLRILDQQFANLWLRALGIAVPLRRTGSVPPIPTCTSGFGVPGATCPSWTNAWSLCKVTVQTVACRGDESVSGGTSFVGPCEKDGAAGGEDVQCGAPVTASDHQSCFAEDGRVLGRTGRGGAERGGEFGRVQVRTFCDREEHRRASTAEQRDQRVLTGCR